MPSRSAFIAILALTLGANAQAPVGDRPMVLDPGTMTKEQLNRRKVDQLFREAIALYGVGILQKRQERLLEALKALEKAQGLDPESVEVRKALVPLYLMFGREPDAQLACKFVLDRDPFDADTGLQYARLLRADARPAEAIAVLKKVAGGKPAAERPDRLVAIFGELYELLDRAGEHSAAASAQDQLIKTITDRKEQLLFGNGVGRDELQLSLARAYERLGKSCVNLKEYDRAARAFRGARDTLLKTEDSTARHQAVRISWNLCEMLDAQGRSAEALEALETYLEHGPAEIEPYDKLVELLTKLDRSREVVPALRKLADREKFNLGVQLLFARELSKSTTTRATAETLYNRLLERAPKPEVYRGLFRLYKDEGRTNEILDLLDAVVKKSDAEATSADDREAAAERGRSITAALRADPEVVKALLPSIRSLGSGPVERPSKTWLFLAHLAARVKQLDAAETCFRNALRSIDPMRMDTAYEGLFEVLRLQRRPTEIANICRDGLVAGRRFGPGMEFTFRFYLTHALTELGEFDEAIKTVNRLIEISNDDLKVRQIASKVHVLTTAGRYDEAVSLCQETLKQFTTPKPVQTMRIALSSTYSKKGDHANSEEQLRLVLEVHPDDPLANNNLGYQLAEQNLKLDEAEELIRKALAGDRRDRQAADLDGENAAYLDSLGWVLFRKGKYADARDNLLKAITHPDGENDPTVWDHLGDVYVRLNELDKARKAWRKANDLFDASQYKKKPDPRRAAIEQKLTDLK